MTGPDVSVVRRKLGFPEDGPYDSAVQAKVRGMAGRVSIQSDGTVNEEVADLLGESAAASAEIDPRWFQRPIGLWDEGPDIRVLNGLLGLGIKDDRYTPETENAVKRFQSAHGLPTTGSVDSNLARLIGEA
jgi:peptidoglycan hydrolase-like protein with peptidoglycan-binding domain